MSGIYRKGKLAGVRCDGCGMFTMNADGYYFIRETQMGGYIVSQSRDCEHDFCYDCENRNPDSCVCPKCKSVRQSPTERGDQMKAESEDRHEL